MKNRIVVALGGNALGNSAKEQRDAVRETAIPIVDLIEAGHEVILAHGNGPQVGMINLAMDSAAKNLPNFAEMPITECVAMSQGYIGYHLQRFIRDELKRRNIDKEVATIVTEVLVDGDDPAFKSPNKPIGAFYTKEEAEKLEKQGYTMMEDAGRGYRRVVASPKPVDIVQKKTIKTLIENSQIVITVGGGGIPVKYAEGKGTLGEFAVIDKDFASAKLAELMDADYLIILTAVEKIAINYGKENEQWLDKLSIDDAKKYIKEGHFAPGSMLPKVEAALGFAVSKQGRRALVTSLEKAKDGIAGLTGTVIVDEK
ncbi:MAG: carbamate kinase [Fusobacteriales bacterium]|jgi:carbamate kinase|nr:carbamate kinase [Fusobacteriales bacterium]